MLRVRHLDGATLQEFHVGLNVFETNQPDLVQILHVMGDLVQESLRAEFRDLEDPDLLRLPLAGSARPPNVSRVTFLSPTELKNQERPEFGPMFSRIRDRISTLRALYGPGPLEIDFKAMGERAAAIRMTRCDLQSGGCPDGARDSATRSAASRASPNMRATSRNSSRILKLRLHRRRPPNRLGKRRNMRLKHFERELVRGFLHEPEHPNGNGLVITHGAGSNSDTTLLKAIAEAFAHAGIVTLRCDLPFRQQRPKGPPFPAQADARPRGIAPRRGSAARNRRTKSLPRRPFLRRQAGDDARRGRAQRCRCAAAALLSFASAAQAAAVAHRPLRIDSDSRGLRPRRARYFRNHRRNAAPRSALIPARTDLAMVEGAGHSLKPSVAAMCVERLSLL